MGQECPGEFRVVGYEVQDFVGDFTCCDYGDPQAPRIARLREEYGLEEVVAGCGTEFEGLGPERVEAGRDPVTLYAVFDHYEIRIDEGAWERCEESFEWPMQEGVHSLACRGVNTMNRPGISSRIEVAYARPPSGTGYY